MVTKRDTLPIAQSRRFSDVVVVLPISAIAMARAPFGPRPWCLISISSLVMRSRTKETGMIPSCEQASRYALRPVGQIKARLTNCDVT